ncbi:MAG: NYN domain-containing protein [Candidatus Taylorbacteria bacterium]|nr:NYN domain-containing protein [Candidatus Taylorbacteria bacterium]
MSVNKIKRFAFIDVQNTASTTTQLLGFVVDWHRLYEYLTDKWMCDKVFFYSGIAKEDIETINEFALLSKAGCMVKMKTYYSYKKPDKRVTIKCKKCGCENLIRLSMGNRHKSNCDVDLTVDAMEEAGFNKEFLIFTGDGDFDCLIQKVVEMGTKVYIVSSNAGIIKPGLNTKRLSSRLKTIIKQYDQGVINLIDINSWKIRIEKKV